ncbi:MAG TPA: tRNA-uridine aminocarboxypropyltransferase [Polyangiaceae bacterium]|nr:tRNA-uridine aminocarboxypropyltransferase [Polyangiaceae bacterium]
MSSTPPASAPTPEGSPAPAGRQTCYQCFRPKTLCYCHDIQRVANKTAIIILQHPRERFHPIGTARIAGLALDRVRVEIDHAGRYSRGNQPLLLPPRTGLVYPEPPFEPLERLAPSERPEHLLLIDGTWHHAHTLFRDVPGLADLPRYGFTPNQPSEYRIRKEPRDECVSTVEAIAHCLEVLEPQTPGIGSLRATFRRMIDRQLAARPSARGGRIVHNQRQVGSRKFPRALVEEFASLVVVYGEWHCPDRYVGERELVQWTARRLRTGESFEALIRPRLPARDDLTRCMELEPSDWSSSIGRDEFEQRWQQFMKPDDQFVAWNPNTSPSRVPQPSGVLPVCVSLKAAYHALGRTPGPLEEIIDAEGLQPAANPCRGRAGRRLGNAEALARFLRAWALGEPVSEPRAVFSEHHC